MEGSFGSRCRADMKEIKVKVDDKTYRRHMKEQAKKPLSFDEMMRH